MAKYLPLIISFLTAKQWYSVFINYNINLSSCKTFNPVICKGYWWPNPWKCVLIPFENGLTYDFENLHFLILIFLLFLSIGLLPTMADLEFKDGVFKSCRHLVFNSEGFGHTVIWTKNLLFQGQLCSLLDHGEQIFERKKLIPIGIEWVWSDGLNQNKVWVMKNRKGSKICC